jgi:hypothetical protein
MYSKKKTLGQFYTTNYNYIFQNFTIPKDTINIIEPFAGKGDLLKFISNHDDLTIECYDIDPKEESSFENKEKIKIKQRDTFKDPPVYNQKFIMTNPPFLALNKTFDKDIFQKYKKDDLYKCFIEQIIRDPCDGGIVILPLNFWCSIRKQDILLRKQFLQLYKIDQLNIFEEKVFQDTKYTICSFQFTSYQKIMTHTHSQNENNKINIETGKNKETEKSKRMNNSNNKNADKNADKNTDKNADKNAEKNVKNDEENKHENQIKSSYPIHITIYPQKIELSCALEQKNNYMVGGEIYQLPQDKTLHIDRLTHQNMNKDHEFHTQILLKCIDDNDHSKIDLKYISLPIDQQKYNCADYTKYIDQTPNLTNRSYAIIVIDKILSIDKQKQLVVSFNQFLNEQREKYHSLFLTNYRETTDIARKRISFTLAFQIINYLLSKSND